MILTLNPLTFLLVGILILPGSGLLRFIDAVALILVVLIGLFGVPDVRF